jgi:hypothetical protein
MEIVVVALIVTTAVGLLALRLVRRLRAPAPGSCGPGCGCSGGCGQRWEER